MKKNLWGKGKGDIIWKLENREGEEGLFAKPLAKISATLNPSTFHFSYNNIHIIK